MALRKRNTKIEKKERGFAEQMAENLIKSLEKSFTNLEVALKEKNVTNTKKEIEEQKKAIELLHSVINNDTIALEMLERLLKLLNKHKRISLKIDAKSKKLVILLENKLIIKLDKENYNFEIENSKTKNIYTLDYNENSQRTLIINNRKKTLDPIMVYISKVFELIKIAMPEFLVIFVRWDNLKMANGETRNLTLTEGLSFEKEIEINKKIIKKEGGGKKSENIKRTNSKRI